MPILIPEALTAVALVALVAGVLSFVVGLWALVRLRRLQRHYDALMTGVDGASLQRAEVLESQVRGAVQHLNLRRYSAFDDGGDQSFSLALLDAMRNGVVLTALLARSGARLYAKPVIDARSAYALTAEEQQAVADALRGEAAVDSGAERSL
jgi:hypothetical protein